MEILFLTFDKIGVTKWDSLCSSCGENIGSAIRYEEYHKTKKGEDGLPLLIRRLCMDCYGDWEDRHWWQKLLTRWG